MRIAVMGAGGVGGYFGARLAQARHAVAFIARGRHLEAMQTSGLRVDSALGNIQLASPTVSDDPASLDACDVVLFAVKLWDTETVAEAIKPLLASGLALIRHTPANLPVPPHILVSRRRQRFCDSCPQIEQLLRIRIVARHASGSRGRLAAAKPDREHRETEKRDNPEHGECDPGEHVLVVHEVDDPDHESARGQKDRRHQTQRLHDLLHQILQALPPQQRTTTNSTNHTNTSKLYSCDSYY